MANQEEEAGPGLLDLPAEIRHLIFLHSGKLLSLEVSPKIPSLIPEAYRTEFAITALASSKPCSTEWNELLVDRLVDPGEPLSARNCAAFLQLDFCTGAFVRRCRHLCFRRTALAALDDFMSMEGMAEDLRERASNSLLDSFATWEARGIEITQSGREGKHDPPLRGWIWVRRLDRHHAIVVNMPTTMISTVPIAMYITTFKGKGCFVWSPCERVMHRLPCRIDLTVDRIPPISFGAPGRRTTAT